MDVAWPAVEPGLLSFLQRIFVTPLRLDAAFDGEIDCEEVLVAAFPHMVDEERRDATAVLMQWKAEVSRPLKRVRMATVSSAMHVLPLPDVLNVQEEYQRITKTSVHCILEMHSKRKQKKYKEDAPDVRSKKFESERRKYSLLLAQVMISAQLPVVALIQTLDDANSAWIHIFAARRANTLKSRYKVWKPFEKWLEMHRGYLFPQSVKDAIDYMQHRVDNGCGRTVPESLSITLGMLEQLGRVPDSAKISEDPLWKGHIKSWTAELSEEAPPRKPAEMFTVAMVIALELLVVEESEPVFTRALAWVLLVMIWGAMRCDDVQAIIPRRSFLSNFGLKLILGQSKTTGPDKVQKEVAVHIFRTVSLTGEDWLRSGFNIWESEEFSFPRDYMVMEPTKDWTKVKRKFVTPSGLSSLISKLLSTLNCPRRSGLGWELMPHVLLLPDGLEEFFSGHSARNFLTSIAAVIGFSRDERAFLGRWSMGMTSSEEYVRTSRQVVFKIQRAVNRSLVEGMDEVYYEDEPIQRLCDAAEKAGANPNRIKKRHSVLSDWGGKHSLGGVYPTLAPLEGDWDDHVDGDGDEMDLAARVADIAQKNTVGDVHTAKYFITISRRTCLRRLHLSGCFVKPDRCCEVSYLDQVTADDFDSVCQACKKKMVAECGRENGEQSSSTASSTSTASEADRDEVPL